MVVSYQISNRWPIFDIKNNKKKGEQNIVKTIEEAVRECKVIEGVGAKSGNPYTAISLELSNGYKELVFLSRPMTEMIKLLRQGE